jgi:hypothetical protein
VLVLMVTMHCVVLGLKDVHLLQQSGGNDGYCKLQRNRTHQAMHTSTYTQMFQSCLFCLGVED